MRRPLPTAFLFLFCLATAVLAQTPSGPEKKPRPALPVSQIQVLFPGTITPQQTSSSKLSLATRAALGLAASGSTNQSAATQQALTIRSLPTFTDSFTFQKKNFPFTMVGQSPQAGGTTVVDTSYLAISFVFDEFLDQNGNNIVIDANGNTKNLLNGPTFERFPYTTGNTQFADAVQRAEFFNVMRKTRHDDDDDDRDDHNGSWHTLLERPRQFKPVTVEVPFGSSIVFVTDDGTFFAFVDINFMNSQLNTLVQTESLRVDEIPIFVTHNTVYADFFFGGCCIGGFHTAFEASQHGNTVFVQTLAFSTSLDANVASFVFNDSTIFADVFALTHEVSELINDPFVNNVVPSWHVPNAGPNDCSNVLETGDPVENLPNPSFPVMIDGFLYHPQTEALLQWFSRETPSSAFGGAYSYPGNNLTTASLACPTGP